MSEIATPTLTDVQTFNNELREAVRIVTRLTHESISTHDRSKLMKLLNRAGLRDCTGKSGFKTFRGFERISQRATLLTRILLEKNPIAPFEIRNRKHGGGYNYYPTGNNPVCGLESFIKTKGELPYNAQLGMNTARDIPYCTNMNSAMTLYRHMVPDGTWASIDTLIEAVDSQDTTIDESIRTEVLRVMKKHPQKRRRIS